MKSKTRVNLGIALLAASAGSAVTGITFTIFFIRRAIDLIPSDPEEMAKAMGSVTTGLGNAFYPTIFGLALGGVLCAAGLANWLGGISQRNAEQIAASFPNKPKPHSTSPPPLNRPGKP